MKQILSTISEIKKEKFWIYFDEDFSPKRGTIIIINGIDYNVFGGLEAEISENDDDGVYGIDPVTGQLVKKSD